MPTKKIKKEKSCCDSSDYSCKCHHGCGGAVYGLGVVGSAIYYISTAEGFWMGILGILKSIVWPVFLIYELLKFVGA